MLLSLLKRIFVEKILVFLLKCVFKMIRSLRRALLSNQLLAIFALLFSKITVFVVSFLSHFTHYKRVYSSYAHTYNQSVV